MVQDDPESTNALVRIPLAVTGMITAVGCAPPADAHDSFSESPSRKSNMFSWVLERSFTAAVCCLFGHGIAFIASYICALFCLLFSFEGFTVFRVVGSVGSMLRALKFVC